MTQAATALGLALPFFVAAGAAISEPNPPLDAARSDIIASGLWGRAESVRTTVRGVFESFAPLAFGVLGERGSKAHRTKSAVP